MSDSGTGSNGIASVSVSIQDSGTTNCWNGTNFSAACPNYIPVSSGGTASGAANASWSYTLANSALTNGDTYTVQVRATDATTSGNTSGNLSAGTFTYDTSAPSSATLTSNGVYNTGGWPGSVTGTVSDSGTGGHGISAVNVSIQDTTVGGSSCWNGSAFSASCPNYVAVSSRRHRVGQRERELELHPRRRQSDERPQLLRPGAGDRRDGQRQHEREPLGRHVRLRDERADDRDAHDQRHLQHRGLARRGERHRDGSRNRKPRHLRGQRLDPGLRHDRKCWNGSDFTTASCPNYVPVSSGGTAAGGANANWSYNLVTGALTDGDTYTVNVQATDATINGNTSGDLSVGTFKYDASAPSSATLASNGNYNAAGWPGAVSGTVSDAGTGSDGISAVNVSIEDSGTSKCWNGSELHHRVAARTTSRSAPAEPPRAARTRAGATRSPTARSPTATRTRSRSRPPTRRPPAPRAATSPPAPSRTTRRTRPARSRSRRPARATTRAAGRGRSRARRRTRAPAATASRRPRSRSRKTAAAARAGTAPTRPATSARAVRTGSPSATGRRRRGHGELELDARHGGARRRLDVPGHAAHEGRDDDREPELERRDELVRLRHDCADALDRCDERGRHDADADVQRAARHRLDPGRGRLSSSSTSRRTAARGRPSRSAASRSPAPP